MLDISVIIPTYNSALFIQETIDSVLNQTLLPKEIIVIDDGSTDATKQIISSIDYPIRYVYQSNAGSATATNKGIKLAKFPYVAFLDHDDLWNPRKLELQSALFIEDSSLEVAYCWVEKFLDCTIKNKSRQFHQQPPMKGFLRSCILFKKSIIEKVGYFQENLTVAESIDWLARVNDSTTKVGIVPDVLVKRRIHSKNTSIIKKSNYKELLGLLRQRMQTQQYEKSGYTVKKRFSTPKS